MYLLKYFILQMVKNYIGNKWALDGTSISTKDYYQLIIIIYIDYYTKKKVPGCYIFFNSKFKSSYIEILKSFKNFLTNENTKNIKVKSIASDLNLD